MNEQAQPAGIGPVEPTVMQHTPGPWQWFERTPGRPYIATPDRGQLYVLGFERKGMQGAGPVFAHWPGIDGGAPRERKGGIMESGFLMRDGSMHPDARLIAAAPDLLAALEELMYARTDKAEKMARDAIFRATGAA